MVGLCRGVVAGACVSAAGCAKSACVDGTCQATRGELQDWCDTSAICQDGMERVAGRCGYRNGTQCKLSSTTFAICTSRTGQPSDRWYLTPDNSAAPAYVCKSGVCM